MDLFGLLTAIAYSKQYVFRSPLDAMHQLSTTVYGRLGDGRLGEKFFEMTIWATRVVRLGDSNWTFEQQSSRRLGDKNEALRVEQP